MIQKISLTLTSPLFTSWAEQLVRLRVDGLQPGDLYALRVDGVPTDFQYDGAFIVLRLGFAKGQTRTLEFVPADACSTDFTRVELPIEELTTIFPLECRVKCEAELLSRTLTRICDGPLFTDYELAYRFAGERQYQVRYRCYQHTRLIEVTEEFNLGTKAEVEMVLNPQLAYDSILSHVPVDFEGDTPPAVTPLNQERPYDLVCRLQFPVLGEYFVPTNRRWLALFDSRHEERGMLGILGLYGARWTNPVTNMPHLYCESGRAVWRAALESGQRFWLLYTGPVEKEFTPTQPFVFDRLHGEFNELRLDEHLDLTGSAVYDAGCWEQPGFFGNDYRERARKNAAALIPLRKTAEKAEYKSLNALLDPQPATQQAVLDAMVARLDKWVRQFQGYRENKGDYNKSVIGFSRVLRMLLIDYELLRKDRFLSDAQIKQLQSYFVFCARRIMDEGRWPHSRSWLHPDHPESTRDIYTYGGEHRPDKLVWTNCLPNFQSDPMCSLLHMSALLPEHPDAAHWQRFALDDIERQLDAYCGRSGAWEESILYALYTMSYFVTAFRVLKNRCGIDYFQDQRVRAFAGWLVHFFGPFDKRFGSHSHPGVGNARVPQQYCECLLAFASELDANDPLRADLISVYQKIEAVLDPGEHRPLLLAIASAPDRQYPLRPLNSEHMDDIGVAMRHAHPTPQESYLFQKIGFFKDHYENDETAFNWHAKGTPFVMEYGTYTGDAGAFAAHNLVEIPEMDGLRRGYLAEKFFSPLVDFTRSEVPVTLKLSYDRIRTWAEVDGPPQKPRFFYLGEQNPVGPKTWKTRLLLFVKPDYVVLFDRVFGAVPHRYNLHVVADDLQRDGAYIRAKGRYDLDLLCFVQHPTKFEFASGEFFPAPHVFGSDAKNPHRQHFFRLYNQTDGIYRTVLFAQERNRDVRIESLGESGLRIVTPEYEDHVFISNEVIRHDEFTGRVGWIRREASGKVSACAPAADRIEAFGVAIEGRGPWSYNMDGKQTVISEGVPRNITVRAPI